MIRSVRGRVFVLFVFMSLFTAAASAQETVCIQCHGSLSGHLSEPVELWKGSVHEENGVSCQHCHGGDPADSAMAMSPERGFIGVPEPEEIPEFCGRCHVGVKEDYLQSAHGEALGSGGPQCVTCHGAHDIAKATPELINREDCSRCHGYGRAEEIKEAVSETDRMIADLEESLNKLHRIGLDTETMRGQVFSQRNRFHRLFHSVDVEKVRERTSGIQQELGEVRQQIESLQEELRWRKAWGAGVVALLLFGAVLAALLRRSYKEEERKDRAEF